MNTYKLVLCESADGWSLHAPGSTDEQIASGESKYLVTGTGTPTQADYQAARAKQMENALHKRFPGLKDKLTVI